MKRQVKDPESPILKNNWQYAKGGKDNSKIGETLFDEQHRICAYTETYLGGRFDSKDVEHFNPTLKNKPTDGYQNWFLVSHKLNSEKGSEARWKKYQDILHPTAENFEERVVYKNGTYLNDPEDKEAKNLIQFLKLDDPKFVEERRLYIKNRRKSIERNGENPADYFQNLLRNEPETVKHIRAIEEEFKIKIDFKTVSK